MVGVYLCPRLRNSARICPMAITYVVLALFSRGGNIYQDQQVRIPAGVGMMVLYR